MSDRTKLTVHQSDQDDVYRDIIRVHKDRRNGVKEAHICHVSVVGGKSALLAVRGLPDCQRDWVRMDAFGRDRLGVSRDIAYEFIFRKASRCEALQWARTAADPNARIATWIAIWGVALGVLGLLVGIAGIYLALKPAC